MTPVGGSAGDDEWCESGGANVAFRWYGGAAADAHHTRDASGLWVRADLAASASAVGGDYEQQDDQRPARRCDEPDDWPPDPDRADTALRSRPPLDRRPQVDWRLQIAARQAVRRARV